MKCLWCKKKKESFVSHHYPVPRKRGGKEIVKICSDCHHYYHHGIIVDASEARNKVEYEGEIRKALSHQFPGLKVIVNPSMIILNPEWMFLGSKKSRDKKSSPRDKKSH